MALEKINIAQPVQGFNSSEAVNSPQTLDQPNTVASDTYFSKNDPLWTNILNSLSGPLGEQQPTSAPAATSLTQPDFKAVAAETPNGVSAFQQSRVNGILKFALAV